MPILLQKTLPVLKTSHRALRNSRTHPVWRSPKCGNRTITTVPTLNSWNIEAFREHAFVPQTPAVLPAQRSTSPIAIKKWFTFRSDSENAEHNNRSLPAELEESFWSKYADLIVPLEITHLSTKDTEQTGFDRIDGPLSLLFANLEATNNHSTQKYLIYLAQHDLRNLPQDLQDDLPMPSLVSHAGRGDLYSSSLWLGRSPTYTPLHRDPNPNLLLQLAGSKSIRLFSPEIGNAIFEYVQHLIDHSDGGKNFPTTLGARSASFRGEEMMKGAERRILHDLVWTDISNELKNEAMLEHAQCATLHCGQALFIPKGWWHSVKGVGDGVTASANWWFR